MGTIGYWPCLKNRSYEKINANLQSQGIASFVNGTSTNCDPLISAMTPFDTCAFSAVVPRTSYLRSLSHGSCFCSAQPRVHRAIVPCSRPILRMTSTNKTRRSNTDRNGDDALVTASAAGIDGNARTIALSEWCVAHGIKMPKLSIRNSPFGRSLVAISDISPSEAMIRVPAAMALSVDTLSADPPPLSHIPLRPDSDFWEGASWEVRARPRPPE